MRSTALAGLLVLAIAAPSSEVWASPKTEGAPARTERFATPRALGRGLVRGVRHTVHAIRPLPKGSKNEAGEALSLRARWMKPVKYTAMVGGIFAAGAAARAVHVDPTPYMLGLSGLAYGYQLKTRALPILRKTRGTERIEALAAEVIYPGLLVAASGLGGMALGHGGESAAASMDTAHQGHAAVHQMSRTAAMLQSGTQSAVIGFDVPTILQGAADHGDLGGAGGAH